MTIKELVNKYQTIKSTNVNKSAIINIITEKEAEKIKLKIGINLNGYVRKVDVFGINHVLKRHGNSKTEMDRGQIHVTINDFELASRITKAENIITKAKNKKGLDVIIYHAVIDNLFIYVEEIRTAKKELV
jgi:hypothetical protein